MEENIQSYQILKLGKSHCYVLRDRSTALIDVHTGIYQVRTRSLNSKDVVRARNIDLRARQPCLVKIMVDL
jgi:hypothetical protein